MDEKNNSVQCYRENVTQERKQKVYTGLNNIIFWHAIENKNSLIFHDLTKKKDQPP